MTRSAARYRRGPSSAARSTRFPRQRRYHEDGFSGDGFGENWCLGHQQAARSGRNSDALRVGVADGQGEGVRRSYSTGSKATSVSVLVHFVRAAVDDPQVLTGVGWVKRALELGCSRQSMTQRQPSATEGLSGWERGPG